jgi:hypothetical protein
VHLVGVRLRLRLHTMCVIMIHECAPFHSFADIRKDTAAAKIFDSMTQEDFKHSIVVTKTAKRLAWIMVIFLNIYFVYFSVLRGITRSVSWQYDYLMACIFQLIVEIVIYETGECLWIHFTIPKLVSEDIATTMNTVKHAIHPLSISERKSLHNCFGFAEIFFCVSKVG